MEKALLQVKSIEKAFPGVKALNKVDFSVRAGEVHALMGENGAGKSTLIKIITGIYKKDAGEIYFDGKILDSSSPLKVEEAGISTIYQELNLIPYLSVAENIFLGREPRKNGLIDWKQINIKAQEIMKSFGVDTDVRQPVNELSAAIQKITAIARAVSIKAKLLIMDEATASLDEQEVETLFRIIEDLKKQNIAIIFISHRLDEVFTIADRVTVLKDGELESVCTIEETDKQRLVCSMIGKEFKENNVSPLQPDKNAKVILKAENISSGKKVNCMNLEIKEGECLGLSGLLGAGRTEFANVIFGNDSNYTGKIFLGKKPIKMKSPRKAILNGLAFLTEDRKTEGIVPNMSVKENITISILSKISRFGVISRKKEEKIVSEYIKKLDIKTPSMNKRICELSGGNQQKVLFARWLATNPKLMILDEPTHGIDVGAKAEIEKIIHDLVKNGISVLMISSEISEMIRSCSRIAIMNDGSKVAELVEEDLNEDMIIHAIANKGIIKGAKTYARH